MVDPIQASSVASSSGTPHPARRALIALTVLALIMLALTMPAVVKRILFPYDLFAWSDDYALNALLKLRLGAPLYGSYEAANSFVDPPGFVLLQHALLAPFGLDLSLVANRILTQAWLVLAIVLGMRLVSRICLGRFAQRPESLVVVVGCGAALALAGYSSALVDSLRPAALELLVLTFAATLAANWPRLSRLGRVATVTLLPACALLVKQNGLSVALAFAIVAWTTTPVSRRERWTYATLSLLSPVLTVAALWVVTHGAFLKWGILLPWRHPFILHHVVGLAVCVAAIGPLLVLIATEVGPTLRDRDKEPQAAWLRVAVFPAAYLLVATPGMLCVGSGASDLGALAFLCAILALAQLQNALTYAPRVLPGATAVMLTALQFLLWTPYRIAPNEGDRASAADVCAHVQEALACGERVLVDLGTACLVDRGLREPPRDRLLSLMDLGWSGLPNASGVAGRLARQEYDLLVVHIFPSPWPWPTAALAAIAQHYAIFYDVPPPNSSPILFVDQSDRPHFDDRRVTDFGIVLFERKRESGRHRTTIEGPARCMNDAPPAGSVQALP